MFLIPILLLLPSRQCVCDFHYLHYPCVNVWVNEPFRDDFKFDSTNVKSMLFAVLSMFNITKSFHYHRAPANPFNQPLRHIQAEKSVFVCSPSSSQALLSPTFYDRWTSFISLFLFTQHIIFYVIVWLSTSYLLSFITSRAEIAIKIHIYGLSHSKPSMCVNH